MNDEINNSFKKTKHYELRKKAIDNDRRIQDLVTYELTKGLTVVLDDTDALPRFAEYKALVKRGSFTLDELEDRVLSKYALVPEKKNEFANIEFLDEEPKKYYKGV